MADKNREPKKAEEKKKTGPESEYDTRVKPHLADIEKFVSHGVTEGQICAFYKIGRTSWAKYKKANPEMSEILCRAREVCQGNLINRAYEIAMGYEYTEETTTQYSIKDGKEGKACIKKQTMHKHAKADAGMMQFLLINRWPKIYARDPHMTNLRRELMEMQKEQMGKASDKESV
jgi:hypothetical protein